MFQNITQKIPSPTKECNDGKLFLDHSVDTNEAHQ